MKSSYLMRNIFLNILFSACFAIGIKYVFFSDFKSDIAAIVICAASLAGIFIFNILTKALSLKFSKSAAFYAVAFTLCVNIGRSLYYNNSFSYIKGSPVNIAFFIVSLIGFFGVVYSINTFFFKLLRRDSEKEKYLRPKKLYDFSPLIRFFIMWGVIFLLWLPVYLSYYPGVFSYDMVNQTMQAAGAFGEGFESYNLNHPPLHTLLWSLCLNLENNTHINAMVVYSIGQMLFLSGVAAKVLHLLFYRKVRLWIIIVSFLFFSVNPVAALFSFSITKDVCFAGFLLLSVIDLIYLVKKPIKYLKMPGFWISFISHTVLSILFRNNALYVFIILIPIAIIILRKYWKRIIPLFVLPVVLALLVTNVVYINLGIQEGSLGETASVPSQQIAKVVKYEDPVSYKDEINRFLPYDTIKEKYNPRFSDPVKFTFDQEYFRDNSGDFYRLWLSIFKKYPGLYLSSFLDLNLPYWYPFANSVDDFSKRAYIETGIYDCEYYKPQRRSFFPAMLEFYESVADFNAFKNIPSFINIFSLPFPIWALLFCFCVLLTKKKGAKQLILSPYFLLWITYIAGPVSNFRYIFPIFFAYPILLALIFDTDKLTVEKEAGD